MEKICIEVHWDPLCSANYGGNGGVGCYKARLENHHSYFAVGESRLEAIQNLLVKCADLEWEYLRT